MRVREGQTRAFSQPRSRSGFYPSLPGPPFRTLGPFIHLTHPSLILAGQGHCEVCETPGTETLGQAGDFGAKIPKPTRKPEAQNPQVPSHPVHLVGMETPAPAPAQTAHEKGPCSGLDGSAGLPRGKGGSEGLRCPASRKWVRLSWGLKYSQAHSSREVVWACHKGTQRVGEQFSRGLGCPGGV